MYKAGKVIWQKHLEYTPSLTWLPVPVQGHSEDSGEVLNQDSSRTRVGLDVRLGKPSLLIINRFLFRPKPFRFTCPVSVPSHFAFSSIVCCWLQFLLLLLAPACAFRPRFQRRPAARSSSSPAGWPDKRAGEERDEKEGDGTEPAKQQEEQNLCVYSAALHDQRERESERGVGKQSQKKVTKLFFSTDLAGLLLLCKIASFIG